MANTNFTAHSNQETKIDQKVTKRSISLKYRAGAIDFSKAVSFEEYTGRRCVCYMKNKVEHRTAWFFSKNRALKAFEILKARYGSALILVD
jgi:hypothetical protein